MSSPKGFIARRIPPLEKEHEQSLYAVEFCEGPLRFMEHPVEAVGGRHKALQRVRHFQQAGMDLDAFWHYTIYIPQAHEFMTIELAPMHIVASKGHHGWIDILAELGADVDGKNGATPPLIQAASKNHQEACAMLIAKGANVNARDALGATVMHAAASRGYTALLDFFWGHGLPLDVRDESESSSTPLHYAAGDDSPDACKALVNLGADVEIEDGDGRTPLAISALAGSRAAAFSLLDCGASLEHIDNNGKNVLQLAHEHENHELALDMEAYSSSRRALKAVESGFSGLDLRSLWRSS